MSSICTKTARAACIACVWNSLAAVPVAVTNHAGHVVRGDLSAISNQTAVIDGRAYPLAVFPTREQVRLVDLFGVPRRPALPHGLELRRRAYRERLARNEQLAKAGAKTPEAAARQRERLHAMWLRAVADEPGLDDATRVWARTRLMGE